MKTGIGAVFLSVLWLAFSSPSNAMETYTIHGIERPVYRHNDPRTLANNFRNYSRKLPDSFQYIDTGLNAFDSKLLDQIAREYAESRENLQKAAELSGYYPYILTSYLSYRERACSNDQGLNQAINARLEKIGLRQAEPEDVPVHWLERGIFQTGQHGVIRRIYNNAFMGVKARLFVNHTDQRMIIAFTGTEFKLFSDPKAFVSSAMTSSWVHGGYGYGYVGQIPNYLIRASAWVSSLINSEPVTIPTAENKLIEIPMLRQALELTQDLQAMYPEYTIELTGTSLGGAIAQYVAMKTRLKAYVFNSLALNNAIDWQLRIEEKDLPPMDELITHAYLQGEILNDSYYSMFLQGTVPLAHGAIPVAGHEIAYTETTAFERMASAYFKHGVMAAIRKTPAVVKEAITGSFYRHTAPALLEAIEGKLDMDLPPLKRNGTKADFC